MSHDRNLIVAFPQPLLGTVLVSAPKGRLRVGDQDPVPVGCGADAPGGREADLAEGGAGPGPALPPPRGRGRFAGV